MVFYFRINRYLYGKSADLINNIKFDKNDDFLNKIIWSENV